MERIWKRHIATIVLALMTVLFLWTFPERHRWWFGFVCHITGAAMVGGLADWYAVTALFRRPLGISFKTALIPRSQKRIAETARHMIEKELLTVPNMYRMIKNNPPMEQLQRYIATEEGEKRLILYCGRAVELGFHFISLPGMRKEIGQGLLHLGQQVRITPILVHLIRRVLQSQSGKEGFRFFLSIGMDIVKTDKAKEVLCSLYEKAMLYYGDTGWVRKVAVSLLLKNDNFSPSHMGSVLQKEILLILEDMSDETSARHKKVWDYFWHWSIRLEEEEPLQEKVESWKEQWLAQVGQEKIEQALSFFLSEERPLPKETLTMELVKACRLSPDSPISTMVNRYLLGAAARWLYVVQHKLGEMAQAQVYQYSPDELSRAMEEKVYYDLQMIRINGSLVGAVMGGLVYLVMTVIRGGALG